MEAPPSRLFGCHFTVLPTITFIERVIGCYAHPKLKSQANPLHARPHIPPVSSDGDCPHSGGTPSCPHSGGPPPWLERSSQAHVGNKTQRHAGGGLPGVATEGCDPFER